jgi:hypothetical protein
VNALDEYAVGFGRICINLHQKTFCRGDSSGLAKVDITPPSDLYVPLLPDNSNGKLLFHLNELKEKTFTSLELKKSFRTWIQDNKDLRCNTI